MEVSLTTQFPYLYNVDVILHLFREHYRDLKTQCCLGAFLTVTAWLFFFGLGYIYMWFFAIPWLLCGALRICTMPTGLHSRAKHWGYTCANMFTLLQLLIFGLSLHKNAIVTLQELFWCSIVAGALPRCRSGLREIVKSIFVCLGVISLFGAFSESELLLKIVMEALRDGVEIESSSVKAQVPSVNGTSDELSIILKYSIQVDLYANEFVDRSLIISRSGKRNFDGSGRGPVPAFATKINIQSSFPANCVVGVHHYKLFVNYQKRLID